MAYGANGGKGGGKPSFGSLGGDGQGGQGDGTGTGDTGDGANDKTHQAKAAAEKLHADTTPPKPTTEGTNNGQGNGKIDRPAEKSEPPAGGSSPVNRGGVSADGNSSQQKTDSKAASTPSDNKTLSTTQQPTVTSAEKSNAAAVKTQTEQAHTSGQNKELIATNPYNAAPKADTSIQPQSHTKSAEATKNPQSPHEGKEPGNEAKVLAQPERSSAMSPEKTQPAHSLEQRAAAAPETRIANNPPQEHVKTPQTESTQTARSQQVDKQQQSEKTLQSDKPQQIAAATPNVENKQFGQSPGRNNNPSEQAPPAGRNDSAAKDVNAKLLNSEQSKIPASDTKPAADATPKQKLEPLNPPPAAGELGQKDSAGGGRIPHEQQGLTEATSKHGNPKFDVAPGEQSVKDAPHKPDVPQPSKETRVDATDNAMPDRSIFIDKSKNSQIDGVKDSSNVVGNRQTEPPSPIRDGKQETRSDKDTKDTSNESVSKSDHRVDSRVSEGSGGGSFGINLEARGNRAEKGEPIERLSILADVKVGEKSIRLDLADRKTLEGLLNAVQQVQDNRITVKDSTGRALLNLVLEIERDKLPALKDSLTLAIKEPSRELGDRIQGLLGEKMPERYKDEMNRLWEKAARSENLVEQVMRTITTWLDRLPFKQSASSNDDGKTLINDFTAGALDVTTENIGKLKLDLLDLRARSRSGEQEVVDDQEQRFVQRTFSAMEEAAKKESENVTDSSLSNTSNSLNRVSSANERPSYVIQEGDTFESIAVKQFNEVSLAGLVKKIAQVEESIAPNGVMISNLYVGRVISLPSEAEVNVARGELANQGQKT